MEYRMKFVTFVGYNREEHIIVFPPIIQHREMARSVTENSLGSLKPISGGFVVNGECIGKSVSLNMKSRGDEDAALLIQLMGK